MDNVNSVLSRIESRWIFAGSLVLLAITTLVLAISVSRLSVTAAKNRKVNLDNHAILQIVKAATGCDETNTAVQCKAKLASAQQISVSGFLAIVNHTTIAAVECHRDLPSAPDSVFEDCVKQRASQ